MGYEVPHPASTSIKTATSPPLMIRHDELETTLEVPFQLTLLFTFNDVEFDHFPVADASQVLLGIVLDDGSLMHKNVFLCVIAINEAVT